MHSAAKRGRWATLAVACGLLVSAPAAAQARARRIDIPAQPLAEALGQIATAEGVSLLFDRRLVAGLRGPAVRGMLSPEQAFERLLKGTRLSARRITAGTYALVTTPVMPARAPPLRETSEPEAAVPDILVTGSRTLNTDIRRKANDIQPYRILSSDDIAEAQSASVDDLLRSRLSANQQATTLSQTPVPSNGMTLSAVDLRGLGTERTLVLVDGRRLPSGPGSVTFNQADLNAIPLSAIERIETYGGTAGGLYGPGATGGVINIVLKQDMPGLWLQGQTGIDQRGDGAQQRIDGGFAVSGFGGATRLSIMGSYGHDDGLRFGDRSFVQLAGQLRASRATNPGPVVSTNVNIMSDDGLPLTLRPVFDGQSIGSTITNIPVNSGGAGGNEAVLLRAGAGAFDYRLSGDGAGALQSLLTRTETRSLIATLSQDIGGHIRLFGNFLYLENDGVAFGPARAQKLYLDSGDARNPFENPIVVTTPTGEIFAYDTRTRVTRATAGLVADLPRGWKLEADAAIGRSAAEQTIPGYTGLGNADILSPGTSLADYIAASPAAASTIHTANTLHDYSLRAAGSLFTLPGGPMTVTIAAEHRDEQVPNYSVYQITAHRISVDSVLGETRMPLTDRTTPFFLLRGIELQLAARTDRTDITVPAFFGTSDIPGVDPPKSGYNTVRQTTVAFTAGAKVEPLKGLILRASYATGFLPPSPGQLISYVELTTAKQGMDPARPGADRANRETPVTILTEGSPDLQPELARTIAVGAVLQPAFVPGLRISIDYLRIRKSHEIVSLYAAYTNHFAKFVTLFPERIERAALTPADIARGFTGGFITRIDASSINIGESLLQTVDLDVDYSRSLPVGHIRIHGTASWMPDYLRDDDPLKDKAIQFAGKVDGPLNWRANGGIEWRHGRLSASLDAQYYGGYKIVAGAYQGDYNALNQQRIAQQGSRRIAPQAYVDLGIAYLAPFANGRTAAFRLGIKNLLDKTPPLVIPSLSYLGQQDYGVGYSSYGDPRGRRFVLTSALSF